MIAHALVAVRAALDEVACAVGIGHMQGRMSIPSVCEDWGRLGAHLSGLLE